MFSMRKLNCMTTNRLILWEFLFGFVKGCFVSSFFFFPRKKNNIHEPTTGFLITSMGRIQSKAAQVNLKGLWKPDYTEVSM